MALGVKRLQGYLGIDVGSVTTKVVAMDEERRVLASVYRRTGGEPIRAVQAGLSEIRDLVAPQFAVRGVGTTGSGRQLTSVVVGGDVVKNEITAHAVAALHLMPDVRTILEIGGQDSKIIILRDGVVVDFAMNSVCAAGTGSFLDRQAARLGLPIEEFGSLALTSESPVRIAGRCAVFAESDMIHKQQVGYPREDIVKGLCEALVRNYLNNVGKGKDVQRPVLFQGGVSANLGIKQAFEEALGFAVQVPEHSKVMGALGAAILAQEAVARSAAPTAFRGFGVVDAHYDTRNFECQVCADKCDIMEVKVDGRVAARWGGRCDRWERVREPHRARAKA